jgi:hypothetical protein
VLAADGDHLVGLFQRHAQGFLEDDVAAAVSGAERSLVMEEVRQADVHDLAVGLGEEVIEIGEDLRDRPVLPELLGTLLLA